MSEKVKSPVSKLAISIFINHVGLTLVFYVLYFTKMYFGVSSKYDILIFSMGILFFTIIIHSSSWEIGDKDRTFINIGRLKKDIYKGFYAGLMAEIPLVLLAICSAINISFENPMLNIFVYASFPFSLLVTDVAWIKFVINLIPVVLVTLVSGFGYILGLKNINISNRLVYAKKKK